MWVWAMTSASLWAALLPPLCEEGRGGGGRGGAVEGLTDPVLHVDAALAGGRGALGVPLH
mgnify:CR=1 FL=1